MNKTSSNNLMSTSFANSPFGQGSKLSRKLLIPILAIVILLAIGLVGYDFYSNSQKNLANETSQLENIQNAVLAQTDGLSNIALGLAEEMASSPEVQAAFASQNRQSLTDITLPTFKEVQKDFAVKQYQFILPPATSFLRLHQLDQFGDDLSSFRATVVEANSKQIKVNGTEIGRGGLGVRGEAPVFYQGKYIGVIDVGIDIGPDFLNTIKKQYGVDVQIMLDKKAAQTATFQGAVNPVAGPTNELLYQAGTISKPIYADAAVYSRILAGQSVTSNLTANNRNYAILSFPLKDFSGNVIGVWEIISDRTEVVAADNWQLLVTILASLGAIALGSFIIIQFINFTIRPIAELTETATAIAGGNLGRRAVVQSTDEIGMLANAFNLMTAQLSNLIGTLEQRVADRTKALSTAGAVSRRISSITNSGQLAVEVVNQLQSAFNYYHAHIYLMDDAGENLIMTGGTGDVGQLLLERGHKISVGKGLVGRAAESKSAIIVPDTSADPNWLPNPLLPNTKSEVAVPILLGNQLLGVLDVQNAEVNSLSNQDVEMIDSIANQVAVALQNIRLFEDAERSRQESQLLVDYAAEAIILVDLKTGNFLEPNASALKLYGLPREELVKVGPAQMSPARQPDGRDSTEKAMEKIGEAMQGESPVFEWTHRNAQGEDILCEVRLVRLPGAHPRVRATVYDITERKHLAELTAQRAKQQEALNRITQKIESTITVEAALQVTARELGHALGMKPTLVTIDRPAQSGEAENKN